MSGIIKNIFGKSTLLISNFSKPPQMAAHVFLYLKQNNYKHVINF